VELPVRAIHALRAGSFELDHRDPFDRMLAAQAVIEGVPLLTDDAAFAAFAELETLW
jgi:PIN domain nuclease of toxin-antitoxin system